MDKVKLLAWKWFMAKCPASSCSLYEWEVLPVLCLNWYSVVVVWFCWGCLLGWVGSFLPVLPDAAFRLFVLFFVCLQVFAGFSAVWVDQLLVFSFVSILVYCALFWGLLEASPAPPVGLGAFSSVVVLLTQFVYYVFLISYLYIYIYFAIKKKSQF